MSEKSPIPDNPENAEKQQRADIKSACLEDVHNSDLDTRQKAFGLSTPGLSRSNDTQIAFNDAFAKTPDLAADDQEETIRRGDHTQITKVNGFVQKITDGDSNLEITYQKNADGQTIVDADGKPKIERVTGSIRSPGAKGHATINIDVASAPGGKRPLSERISVTQDGADIGDLSIEEPDGNKLATIRGEDFARISHDRVTTENNGDAWRIRKLTKLNEAKTGYSVYAYNYDDAHNHPEELLERIKYVVSPSIKDPVRQETMQKRANDTGYNVITYDTLSLTPTRRDVRSFDITTGAMAFSDREQIRYSDLTDRNVGSAAVIAAREKLVKELEKYTDFTDTAQFKEWIDKIEGRKPSWMSSLRDKGWKAPDNKDIAGTYDALGQFLVGERSGIGTGVGNKQRVDLVLKGVRQFSDTWKFGGNQNDMPSCGRAALAGCCVRANPAQFYGLMAEAVNKGRVTYNGTDERGNKVWVNLDPIDFQNTDQRCSIDELEQKVFAKVMGSRGGTDNFGTNSEHAKYVYHFVTGHNNLPVLDFNALHPQMRHDSTIRENQESILETLKDRSIWIMFPGHAERMENAKITGNQVEFLITNSHKLDGGNEDTYSPGTGLFRLKDLGPHRMTVDPNADYRKYFRKKK